MSTNVRKIEITYRYFGLDYLVSDKHGNIYLIPHFRFRRTVFFKKIIPFSNEKDNPKKNMIKYHGSNISFKQLREREIPVDEIIDVY